MFSLLLIGCGGAIRYAIATRRPRALDRGRIGMRYARDSQLRCNLALRVVQTLRAESGTDALRSVSSCLHFHKFRLQQVQRFSASQYPVGWASTVESDCDFYHSKFFDSLLHV